MKKGNVHMDDQDHLLRQPAVLKLCCLGRTRVYELRKLGVFPLPLTGFGNRLIWRASDIQAWIAAREAM